MSQPTTPTPAPLAGPDARDEAPRVRHCPKCRGFVRTEPALLVCINCGWRAETHGDLSLQHQIDHALRGRWPATAPSPERRA
jgi:hypothetical protein